MKIRANAIAITATIAVATSIICSIATAAPLDLPEIRKTCTGFVNINANAAGGQIDYKNLQLSITGGNTLNVSHEGVLLAQVKDFHYGDVSKCVTDLAGIISKIDVPSQSQNCVNNGNNSGCIQNNNTGK